MRGFNGQLLALKIQNGMLHMLDWSNPKKRQTYPCSGKLEVKKFYHVAWVMTGDEWLCYLDGKLTARKPSQAAVNRLPVKAMHIGNDFHNAVHQRDRFVGTLDEFKIYNSILPGAQIAAAAAKLASAAPYQAAPLSVTSDVKPIVVSVDNTTQSFVFDGKREPLMIYCGGGFLPMAGYSFSTVHKMHEQGISVFRSGPEGGRDFCGSTWWQGIGKYDFEIVDRNIQFVFERNPDAKLILQVAACPPDWWGRQFPEECTQDINGNVRQDYFASHSYSSKKWLADLEEAILNNLPLSGELEKHAQWVEELRKKYTFTKENTARILQEEVGQVFAQVLEHAGVYKRTAEGRAAFLRFAEYVNAASEAN